MTNIYSSDLMMFLKSLEEHGGFVDYGVKVDISTRSRRGDLPIHWAAILGNSSLIKEFVMLGVNINEMGENGSSTLDYAVIHKNQAAIDEIKSLGGIMLLYNNVVA